MWVPWSPCSPSHGNQTSSPMMFDHVLEHCQCVPLFGRLVAFFVTILLVWIVLYFPFGDMPTPSLTDKDCHDVARLWEWKWVRQDNQDMKAKAVMRWTCASCGESKDVRFDNMKKFGPGKHKCSKQSQPQEKEANAKVKDGRPSVTTLHCHQLAAEYGCDWLGVVVDNTVHVDDSLISSIRVMRWQCWGCTTTFDRTYKKMKSQGFVCSTCNASQSKEDKKRAGQAGGVVASREDKQRAGQAGTKENKQRAGQAGSKENKQRAGQAGSKENKQRAGQAGSKENKQRARQAGSKENKQRAGQAGSKENKQRAGQAAPRRTSSGRGKRAPRRTSSGQGKRAPRRTSSGQGKRVVWWHPERTSSRRDRLARRRTHMYHRCPA